RLHDRDADQRPPPRVHPVSLEEHVPAPIRSGGLLSSSRHFFSVPASSFFADLLEYAFAISRPASLPLVARYIAMIIEHHSPQARSGFGITATASAMRFTSAVPSPSAGWWGSDSCDGNADPMYGGASFTLTMRTRCGSPLRWTNPGRRMTCGRSCMAGS